MEVIEIPNKSSFKLNEVCSITGVKPYVLRFWESEFEEIEPMTSSTGQKLYAPKDIEAIALAKDLLFNQKMSIEEAKYQLASKLEEQFQKQFGGDSIEAEEISLEESSSVHDSQAFDDVPPSFDHLNIEAPSIPSISLQREFLSDSDLEKIVMAKNLLREIVEF